MPAQSRPPRVRSQRELRLSLSAGIAIREDDDDANEDEQIADELASLQATLGSQFI